MRAGFLRRRLELLGDDDVVVRDSFGQARKTPVVLGTFWAGVRPARRPEAVDGPRVVGSTRHEVTLRWQGPALAIGPEMRLRLAGTARVLQVLAVVDVDERRATYQLDCLERTTP